MKTEESLVYMRRKALSNLYKEDIMVGIIESLSPVIGIGTAVAVVYLLYVSQPLWEMIPRLLGY